MKQQKRPRKKPLSLKTKTDSYDIMQTCRSNHKNQDIIRNNRVSMRDAGTGRT